MCNRLPEVCPAFYDLFFQLLRWRAYSCALRQRAKCTCVPPAARAGLRLTREVGTSTSSDLVRRSSAPIPDVVGSAFVRSASQRPALSCEHLRVVSTLYVCFTFLKDEYRKASFLLCKIFICALCSTDWTGLLTRFVKCSLRPSYQ